MATVGGALPGRTGILLYSAQTTQGTPVTPAAAVGIASFDVTSDSGMQGVHALGQAAALFVKEGRSVVNATINITAFQDETLLLRAQRVAGVVPWTTFGFAYEDDPGTDYMWQVQDCKIGSYDVAVAGDGLMTATLNVTGGLITDVTSLVEPVNLTGTIFGGWDAVLTKGGAAHESVAFRLNVNHNLEPQFILPGAAVASFKRGFAYLIEGQEQITGEITRFAKSGIDLQAASVSDFALVLTMTDLGGTGNATTFTFAGVKWGSERWAVSPEGRHEFTTPFIAKTVVIS